MTADIRMTKAQCHHLIQKFEILGDQASAHAVLNADFLQFIRKLIQQRKVLLVPQNMHQRIAGHQVNQDKIDGDYGEYQADCP